MESTGIKDTNGIEIQIGNRVQIHVFEQYGGDESEREYTGKLVWIEKDIENAPIYSYGIDFDQNFMNNQTYEGKVPFAQIYGMHEESLTVIQN